MLTLLELYLAFSKLKNGIKFHQEVAGKLLNLIEKIGFETGKYFSHLPSKILKQNWKITLFNFRNVRFRQQKRGASYNYSAAETAALSNCNEELDMYRVDLHQQQQVPIQTRFKTFAFFHCVPPNHILTTKKL